MRVPLLFLAACALAALAAVVPPQALEAAGPPSLQKHPKLHFRLLELIKKGPPPAPLTQGPVRTDEQGRVQVSIRAEPITPELLEQITARGGKIDGQTADAIQAWVPIAALEPLAGLPEVRYIQPPHYARANLGSVTTQGDAGLNAAAMRQQFGVSGQGIRVGVISTGILGLETSIASGDLPATTFHCKLPTSPTATLRSSGCLVNEKLIQTTGGVRGEPSLSSGNLAPPGSAHAEGTAMLEIVHDLAPGAELWFAGAETGLDLQHAAEFLAANVDVIVSDLGLPQHFPDGQNAVAQAVAGILTNQSNRARALIQSVGNNAVSHYAGTYTASDFNFSFLPSTQGHTHLFASNSETTSLGTGGVDDPGPFNFLTLPPGGTVSVALTWNDLEGQSANDYDLVVGDCAASFDPAISAQTQAGFQDPVEFVEYPNPSQTDPLCLTYFIVNFNDQAAPRILNVLIGTNFSDQVLEHEFNTPGKSLLAPADATGDLIAVGAVAASTPDQVESFSSRGPTFDGRSKPDVVATDGVTVTGAGGFSSPFFGTSAAAPHVAGLAALLLELNPTLTRSQLKAVLAQTAVAIGNVPDANVSGSGRVDALAAANAAVFPLTVSKAGDGSGRVRSRAAGINCGTTCSAFMPVGAPVTLVPLPPRESMFMGWSGACSGVGLCTVVMDAAKTVTATFNSRRFRLTVSKLGAGGGAVASSPAGITCGADCTEDFLLHSRVTLKATPATGSVFQGWSGACTGRGSCLVEMNAARTAIATFTPLQFRLSVIPQGAGRGTVTSTPPGITCGAHCRESYPALTQVTLTAVPVNGSTFTGWNGSGCAGTGTCVITLQAAASVTATFAPQ